MISYCVAVLRPTYARLLVEDLIIKTSTNFEILVWLNTEDIEFESMLQQCAARGAPITVVGKTPENIGMRAYRELFRAAQFPLVVQIDDDVVRVSRGIAERATQVFARFPQVRQLVADVWRDKYTNGARPSLKKNYRVFDPEKELYYGPLDGWFSIYHRSILPIVDSLHYEEYFGLGWKVRDLLRDRGMWGLLDTGMKVFHVVGPTYASFFGMLESEITKYQRVGRTDLVTWYSDARRNLPSRAELEAQFALINQSLDRK